MTAKETKLSLPGDYYCPKNKDTDCTNEVPEVPLELCTTTIIEKDVARSREVEGSHESAKESTHEPFTKASPTSD